MGASVEERKRRHRVALNLHEKMSRLARSLARWLRNNARFLDVTTHSAIILRSDVPRGGSARLSREIYAARCEIEATYKSRV